MVSTEINFIVHDDPAIRPRRPRLAMIDLAPFEFDGQMEEVWLRSAGGGELVSEWSGDRHVAIHVPSGELPAGPLGTAIDESHDVVVSEWADVEPFRTG